MHSPITIEGTPLMTVDMKRTSREKWFLPPYSCRETAPSTPSGTAITVAAPVTISVPRMAGPMPPPGRRAMLGISVTKKSGNSWTAPAAPRTPTAQTIATSGAAMATTDPIISDVMMALFTDRKLCLAVRSGGPTAVSVCCASSITVPSQSLGPLHRALNDRRRDQVDDDGDDEQRDGQRDQRRLVQRVRLAPFVGDDGGHRVAGRQRAQRQLPQRRADHQRRRDGLPH